MTMWPFSPIVSSTMAAVVAAGVEEVVTSTVKAVVEVGALNKEARLSQVSAKSPWPSSFGTMDTASLLLLLLLRLL